MPNQRKRGPLGQFLQALHEEKIDCILIGAMAAAEQGATLGTIDWDFWVNLSRRHVVKIYGIVQKQKGTLRAPTLFELRDGTQVNIVLEPDGLQSFKTEAARSSCVEFDGTAVKVLPLSRVIASKEASGRDKDLAVLPYLKKVLRARKKILKGPRTRKRRPVA